MVQKARQFFSQSFNDTLNKIIAGIIVAFMVTMLSFSLSSLLFSGRLEAYYAQGVGIFLASSLVGIVVLSFLSSRHHIIPSMQSSLILIITTMATSMVIAPGKDLLATVLVLLPLTALFTGLAYLTIGQLRLVKFIRYVPYPVIGGFLAGNGILLIIGAMQVMTPFDLTLATILDLISVQYLMTWLPGVLTAIILFGLMRQYNQYLLIPFVLIGGVVAVYALILAQGLSFPEAGQQGILLGDIGSIEFTAPIFLDFSQVDWGAIQSQWANMLTVMMVALIHLPLNLTGIELIKKDDIDLDQQVQSNGIMNLLIALVGGNVGFASASISTMNHRIGGTSRLVYVIASLCLFGLLIVGSQILFYVPVAILGALLIFIGLDFIDSWIVQGLDKFTRSEYVVAVLIMLTVIFVGFLEGVALGTLVMLVVFVGTYSRVSNIYRSVSAKNLSSTVERSPHFTKELFTLRDQVWVLELTGFLFFGTAESIVIEAKSRIDDTDAPPLKYIIIDFRRVAGVDSSALLSLNKIIKLAEINEFDVIFSNFADNPSILRILKDLSSSDRLEFSSDLDHAIERTETELLEYAGTTQAFVSTVIWMQLHDMGMKTKAAKQVAKYMKRTKYDPDTIIINQGDLADSMYFVEIGQVSIFLNFNTENPIRLRTIGMGAVVGELGFFLNRKRTATVIADMTSFIYELTRENLELMKEEQPELAFAFEGMMLRVVANRLTTNNNLIEVLK